MIDAKTVKVEYKGAKNELLWTANIDLARFRQNPQQTRRGTTGTMTGVSGEIFSNSQVSCRYKSVHGTAVNNPTRRILTLTDQVQIDAVEPPGKLLCDKLIYDGIKKVFRAIGHVQVLGAIGSKGTLDEAWATPDLTRVASPELFDQPMKRLLLIPLALLSGAANPQVFTDGKGLTAYAKLYSIEKPKVVKKPVHLVLMKSVSVVSEPQGLNLTSDTMTLNALPVSATSKGYQINDAVATGHVTVIKSTTSKAGRQTTRIDGPDAVYTAGLKESTVKMSGPMIIHSIDESGRPTMDATGNSGIAYLEPLKQTKLQDALHRAMMDGNVHLTLTQYDTKTNLKSSVRTTSDHMLIEEMSDGRHVTLTGSVHIASEDFELKDIKRAVFVLAKDGGLKMNTTEAK